MQDMIGKSQKHYANDMLGVITRSSGGVFPMDAVDRLFTTPGLTPASGFQLPSIIFVSVDPGDNGSDTAATVFCYDNTNGFMVVRHARMHVCVRVGMHVCCVQFLNALANIEWPPSA